MRRRNAFSLQLEWLLSKAQNRQKSGRVGIDRNHLIGAKRKSRLNWHNGGSVKRRRNESKASNSREEESVYNGWCGFEMKEVSAEGQHELRSQLLRRTQPLRGRDNPKAREESGVAEGVAPRKAVVNEVCVPFLEKPLSFFVELNRIPQKMKGSHWISFRSPIFQPNPHPSFSKRRRARARAKRNFKWAKQPR